MSTLKTVPSYFLLSWKLHAEIYSIMSNLLKLGTITYKVKSNLYCYAYVHSPKPNSPWVQLEMINSVGRKFLKFFKKFSKSIFLYFSLRCVVQILTVFLSSSNGFFLISHQKVLPFLEVTVEMCGKKLSLISTIESEHWELKGQVLFSQKSLGTSGGSSACPTAFEITLMFTFYSQYKNNACSQYIIWGNR